MRSCLEKEGHIERVNETIHNDYNPFKPYWVNHRDAVSGGSPQGKGILSGGHGHWQPNCIIKTLINTINYLNFDTIHGGGCYDKIGGYWHPYGRDVQLARNNYNIGHTYSYNGVKDTEKLLNLEER